MPAELVFGRVIRARSGMSLSLNLFLRLLSSRNLVSKKWEVSPCWEDFTGAIVAAELIFSHCRSVIFFGANPGSE